MSQPRQYATAPSWLPIDEEIIDFCRSQRRLGARTLVYTSQSATTAFIKIGSLKFGIIAERSNQEFAFKALEALPQQKRPGIWIPKIHRMIEDVDTVYIIMEYTQGKSLKELLNQEILHALYYNQISKAIRLFLSFEVPNDITPGPVGGGTIKHPLFKDTIASIEYRSFDALQRHVNNVANLSKTNNLNIDFQNDDVCFCYSDLFEGNFIFTDEGSLYIVDFEYAAFLPTSFMAYALDQP